ncbi:hypothetical protein B0H11DRAFT_1938905 [Mycena galericulata]|nr:hypothetical protein B0H11DRAFT_1938905 [Mycena galericulata]
MRGRCGRCKGGRRKEEGEQMGEEAGKDYRDHDASRDARGRKSRGSERQGKEREMKEDEQRGGVGEEVEDREGKVNQDGRVGRRRGAWMGASSGREREREGEDTGTVWYRAAGVASACVGVGVGVGVSEGREGTGREGRNLMNGLGGMAGEKGLRNGTCP